MSITKLALPVELSAIHKYYRFHFAYGKMKTAPHHFSFVRITFENNPESMLELASLLLNLNVSTTSNLDIPYSEKVLLPIRIAHEVKTSNSVGGTIHIEPNDRPIAGKKSRVWIALTKRGGEIIPYEKCNCRLEVRSLTNKAIKFIVPKSTSIIDLYLGLPSLEVTFPEVGRYELRLNGSAKRTGDFPDFELTFTTNVGR